MFLGVTRVISAVALGELLGRIAPEPTGGEERATKDPPRARGEERYGGEETNARDSKVAWVDDD